MIITDTDRDFDPSADMMVHDFDDERTLDEEEAMSGESCSNELDDLEKVCSSDLESLSSLSGESLSSVELEELNEVCDMGRNTS